MSARGGHDGDRREHQESIVFHGLEAIHAFLGGPERGFRVGAILRRRSCEKSAMIETESIAGTLVDPPEEVEHPPELPEESVPRHWCVAGSQVDPLAQSSEVAHCEGHVPSVVQR